MIKWLTITLVVISVFFILLLGLGYLLKSNETETKQLIVKLKKENSVLAEQQRIDNARQAGHLVNTNDTLTSQQKSFQTIVTNHRYCSIDKQCFIINTLDVSLGCFVAVNRQGAAILLKVVSMKKQNQKQKESASTCMTTTSSAVAKCKNHLCLIK